jgi:mono/diheme cytochrome c family protein
MRRLIGDIAVAGTVMTAVVGLSTHAALAQETANAKRGAALAESWCANCHIIDAKGTGQSVEAARPFPSIARDPTRDTDFLQNWLTTKHPQMPNLDLGRREINDLAAYIRTLAPAVR